mmetsp:Transcript_5090/g.14305  ORF Transcript_5090/g.14305 Transcript_5090/m.14305 type:complete len:235 (+) Transcript_5090:681-1385(+)
MRPRWGGLRRERRFDGRGRQRGRPRQRHLESLRRRGRERRGRGCRERRGLERIKRERSHHRLRGRREVWQGNCLRGRWEVRQGRRCRRREDRTAASTEVGSLAEHPLNFRLLVGLRVLGAPTQPILSRWRGHCRQVVLRRRRRRGGRGLRRARLRRRRRCWHVEGGTRVCRIQQAQGALGEERLHDGVSLWVLRPELRQLVWVLQAVSGEPRAGRGLGSGSGSAGRRWRCRQSQ